MLSNTATLIRSKVEQDAADPALLGNNVNALKGSTTPTGERLVVLAEADYLALVEAHEDAADIRAVETFRTRLGAGEEELIPSEVVDRLLSGESRVRVWREHRDLRMGELAERAGIASAYLSQIETGKREGTVKIYRKLAAALDLGIEDLVN
ncbi:MULTISPECIES: helix-turn-helix transcriptional regulator [unclassified Methylobacterium]|uniref:helix-turn-helix domain-containing protein n=1 Tax=unclassified Methylobacterium TaxID=2615210 RepID=UPI00226A2E4B|nr:MULTISPECIES: helix-turn-helix transcriptional regulator [unclassified Methylobacterium]